MKKEYLKPQVEIISLEAQERLTDLDLNSIISGDTDMEDSEF